jgi:hypothetical protein
MTRRTRRLLLFALPAGVAVAIVAAWLLLSRTAITPENAVKIQVGMTVAEVEAILGGPARDESTGPLVSDGPGDLGYRAPEQAIVLVPDGGLVSVPGGWHVVPSPPQWVSDCAVIVVSLDAGGRVEACSTLPVRRVSEGPIDRVRRWLGL